tara:strand:- start:1139 stop:2446 length:1308 start_codon:yes stop_codon:yes gene_type:complete
MSEINRYGISGGAAVQVASGYFPEGQSPSSLNDGVRAVMADVRRYVQQTTPEITASGSSNNYTLTLDRDLTAGELTEGFTTAFVADFTNDASATLNINAVGAKQLRDSVGNPLSGNEIQRYQSVNAMYNKKLDSFNVTDQLMKFNAIPTFPAGTIVADDITTGDAAVTIATTSGNITVENHASDADILLKGNDGGSVVTALQLDMSDAGRLVTSGGLNVATNVRLGHGNDGTTFNHYFGNCNVRLGQNADGTDLDMNGQGLFIFDDQGSAGTTFTAVKVYNSSGGSPIWQNKLSGTIKSEIESNGDFQSATNSYGSTSDVNLKENIVDSGSQWTDIKNIRVRKFSFKEDNLDAPNMIGVIAQELEAAGMGKLVKTHLETNPDANGNDAPVLDSDGNQKSYKSAKYSIIHMKALKALQEAMARIETLETKVAALEG